MIPNETLGDSSAEAEPLTARVFRDPLLIEPSKASLALSYVRAAAARLVGPSAMAGDDDFWDVEGHPYRPYRVKEGVLYIPVEGMLLNRFPYAIGQWATGYEYIENALLRGLGDSAVQGIALMVDSPGGVVSGCFELSDSIFAARAVKPVRAFVSDSAYSAAYALASAAESVMLTRSAGSGSVGVVTTHVDYSEYLANSGIKVTMVYAGKHKIDGNPNEPLPDPVKARIQDRIDKIYSVFVSTVARNRNLSDDAVRKTEALCYDADESLEVGFADRIGSVKEGTANFAQEVARKTFYMESKNMTENITTAASAEALAAEFDKGFKAGSASEKARITSILALAEANGRPVSAMAAALETDMAPEAAARFLAKLPVESAVEKPKASPFDREMGRTVNPAVGAEPVEDKAEEADPVSSLKQAARASIGMKFVK